MNLSQSAFTEGIRSYAEKVQSLEEAALQAAAKHVDFLTKPPGSLGTLESVAIQVAAIRQGKMTLPLKKSAVVFAADHGVARAGVSAYPPEVTTQMVLNFLRGGAGISVLTRQHGAELSIVDVGVDTEFAPQEGLYLRKVRRSSRNFVEEPAMTAEELTAAMNAGFEVAERNRENGVDLVIAGEMGIGNTTPASAIAAVITGHEVSEVTGKGSGVAEEARLRKEKVIRQALELHHLDGSSVSPLEVLRCVGGLEIASMAAFYLASAANRQIILMDGFIATAAASVVCAIAPAASQYMIAGHCSEEPGHRILLEHLGLNPLLRLNMRLGEGTGAVLAIPIVESAIHVYSEMATFASAGISGASA